SVWTFVYCGKDGDPSGGVYNARYLLAAESGLAVHGRRAEFITDDDLPEPLRYRGSWGMLGFYNPDLDIGNPNGSIYAAGLDTAFIRNLDELEAALDACPADIAGVRCFVDGKFNTQVIRVRRGSEGARKLWAAGVACDFQFHDRCEHRAIRRIAGEHTGTIPDHLTESYKLYTRHAVFPERDRQELDDISALVFHGVPRPHDVCEDTAAPLHDFVMKHWGRYAGY
ncbi:MAG: hypothetical protein GY906_18175, partial [bacterium]|nr:hypothetical protein [bacterium]